MTTPILSCIEEVSAPNGEKPISGTLTIRCYVHSSVARSPLIALSLDRRLATQAMTLLMRIDGDLRFARAGWNEDRFRRLMRLRSKAVRRLQRRWVKVAPKPRMPLGSLRRRYHANVAGYLYRSEDLYRSEE
jgi:hypothetical protein